MKIAQAQVELASSHYASQQRELSETLQVFRREGEGDLRQVSLQQGSKVSLSTRAVEMARQVERQDGQLNGLFKTSAIRNPGAISPAPSLHEHLPSHPVHGVSSQVEGAQASQSEGATLLDSRMLLIKQIVEQFSGRSLQLFDPVALQGGAASPEPFAQTAPEPLTTAENRTTSAVQYGMHYSRSETYSEAEQTEFSALARVTTADGRELNLQLQLSMSRQFVSQSRVEIQAGVQLRDPLVINLGQGAVQLSERSQGIDFDLNADGQRERIAFVGGDSGLLALDRNGDGEINDGSELFGALSGNGFADLLAFDEDGNGFIDAGDSLFGQLRIWVREAGEDKLLALADQGIGALYLGYSDTPFALKDEQNRLLGMIRNTGVYLNEDGSGGTLQQIDLVS
ncbi:MAG TPA: hypothetical protein VIS52_00960 [Motiliproteus sp.]